MARLTALEHRIVALVAEEGLSAKAIAARMGRSRRTVEHHIARIARKVGGPGRPRERLVAFYHRAGRPADA